MLKLNFFILSLFLLFTSSSEIKTEQNLVVSYSAISCTCAQWKIENKKSGKNIYLERANDKVIDANNIWDGQTLPLRLKIKGYFKKQLGLPKGYEKLKGDPKPGKVFVYSQIKVINNVHPRTIQKRKPTGN